MNKKRRNIRQRGMTLLEIMIVLAIIALIMVFLIGPRVLKSLSKSESRSGCIESKQLAYDAYTEWRADTRKSCPGGLAELLEYSNKKDIKDPWGNDYQMMCKDKMPAGSKHPFGVYTYGPDGAEGGGDDIKSWECE